MSLLLDRERLAAFRAGDPRVLEQVYYAYLPELTGYLDRGFTFRSGSRSYRFRGFAEPFDLNNAVQETFLRVFTDSARAAYDGINPFRVYLLTIARNLVIDQLRKREIATVQMVELEGGEDGAGGVLGELEPDSSTAEDDFLIQEMGQLYQEFVAGLDEREATFFRARFERELSGLGVAREYGLTRMQMRTLENKLRDRFLRFMQSKGYLEHYERSGT
jgi:RNA polymerase sigma-70 factor (ECF subfamily)